MDIDHVRHSGIFNAQGWRVSLIGAGGIGSPTALALAKMGIEYLEVYDEDRVDPVNVAVQMYGNQDIGMYKAYALQEMVVRYAANVVVPCALRVSGADCFETDIVISAVDSLSARKEIWEAVKKSHPAWYLDARMGSENFQLFSVDMTQQYDWYEYIVGSFNDEDVETLPCTSKATIYCAFIGAGIIGKTVRQIVSGKIPPKILSYDIVNDRIGTA